MESNRFELTFYGKKMSLYVTTSLLVKYLENTTNSVKNADKKCWVTEEKITDWIIL